MKALDRQTTPQIALPMAIPPGRPGRRGRRKALGTAAIWPAPSAPPPARDRLCRAVGEEGPGGVTPAVPAAPPDRAPRPDSAVLRWNKAALAAIRATRPAPPVAARALAILHTAIFDAWAHFDVVASPGSGPRSHPFPGRSLARTRLVARPGRGPRGRRGRRPASQRAAEHKRAAVSAAADLALRHLFPTRISVLELPAHRARLRPPRRGNPLWEDFLSVVLWARSQRYPGEVGTAAARAVLSIASARMGRTRREATPTPPGTPPSTPRTRCVTPTAGSPCACPTPRRRHPAVHRPPLAPGRPFALASGTPAPPHRGPRATPGGYRAQAEAILRLSAGLTDRQKAIAEYWSDGPATETRRGTGASSPRSLPARRARPGRGTSGCTSPSPTPSWTPASPPGTPSAPSTTCARSRPSATSSAAAR